MSEEEMAVEASWSGYIRFMNGLTAVMFLATLILLEVALGGYLDGFGGETAVFRAAVPNVVAPPLVAGTLMGHWFHPGRYGPDLLTYARWTNFGPSTGFWIVLGLGLGLSAVGVATYVDAITGNVLGVIVPGWAMLALGLVLGTVLWPVYDLSETRSAWREARNLVVEEPTEGDARAAFWLRVSFALGWAVVAAVIVATALLENIAWGVIAAGAFWLVYILVTDIFLVRNSVIGDTWSEQLRVWGTQFTPVVPWVFGLLAGRWFHPLADRMVDADLGLPLAGGATLAVVVIGFVVRVPPWIVVLLAIVAGACLIPATFPSA